jgi:hypothetical protein
MVSPAWAAASAARSEPAPLSLPFVTVMIAMMPLLECVRAIALRLLTKGDCLSVEEAQN